MYLLDTNIRIAILGVYCSTQLERNLDTLTRFANQLPIIAFDQQAAIEFGKIQSELRKIGKPTGQLDALIASVARSRQDILVTDNTRHFENISNLVIENWLQP